MPASSSSTTDPGAVSAWHFFISYTDADLQWAEWISWHLEEAGYSVLLQAWDSVPGSHWIRKMGQGIQEAQRTISLISKNYIDSIYGMAEWESVFRSDPQGLLRRLIPIRIEDCELPAILGSVSFFDLFGLTVDEARERLLSQVRSAAKGRAKPPTEPIFPESSVVTKSLQPPTFPGHYGVQASSGRNDISAHFLTATPSRGANYHLGKWIRIPHKGRRAVSVRLKTRRNTPSFRKSRVVLLSVVALLALWSIALSRIWQNEVPSRQLQTDAASSKVLAADGSQIAILDRKGIEESCRNSNATYLCRFVVDTLLSDPNFAPNQAEALRLLTEGGLVIETTIEPDVQEAAEKAITELTPVESGVVAVSAMVQPQTGRVLSLAMNREYGAEIDDMSATQDVSPSTQYVFRPGSTADLFVLAAALEKGLPLNTTFHSPACYQSEVFVNPAERECLGATRNPGDYTMITATWEGVTPYFVQLAEKVGILDISRMARNLGVTSCRYQEHGGNSCNGIRGPSSRDASIALGGSELSVLDLANSYATIVARGLMCTPVAIESVRRANGEPVRVKNQIDCNQTLNPAIADTVSSVLQGVITRGNAQPNAQILRSAGGLTGATQDFTGASFAGYVPQLAAAVMIANPALPDPRPFEYILGAQPEGVAAQIWARIMIRSINAFALPVIPLPPPTALSSG